MSAEIATLESLDHKENILNGYWYGINCIVVSIMSQWAFIYLEIFLNDNLNLKNQSI